MVKSPFFVLRFLRLLCQMKVLPSATGDLGVQLRQVALWHFCLVPGCNGDRKRGSKGTPNSFAFRLWSIQFFQSSTKLSVSNHPIKSSKILQVSPGFEATPSHHPYHSSLGLSQFILHCCKGGRCHLLHVARPVHSDLQAAVETLPRCGVEISRWNPENRLSTVDCYG